jgi:hypothetical protein
MCLDFLCARTRDLSRVHGHKKQALEEEVTKIRIRVLYYKHLVRGVREASLCLLKDEKRQHCSTRMRLMTRRLLPKKGILMQLLGQVRVVRPNWSIGFSLLTCYWCDFTFYFFTSHMCINSEIPGEGCWNSWGIYVIFCNSRGINSLLFYKSRCLSGWIFETNWLGVAVFCVLTVIVQERSENGK